MKDRILSSAVIAIVACAVETSGQTCTNDLNGDGVVDAADLALVLSSWGTTYEAEIASITPAIGGS